MSNTDYPDLASIHKTAERCKTENIPLSEKALRRFVRNRELAAIQTGTKTLLLWDNVLAFVRAGNNARAEECAQTGYIRPIPEQMERRA